jgi:hypothetical protein
MTNSSSNPDLAAQAAQFRQRAAAERTTSSSSPPLQQRRSLLSPQYADEYLEASPEKGFENGLGTWAGRQQVFSRVAFEEEQLEQQREDFENGARHRAAVYGLNGTNEQGSNDTNISNSTVENINSTRSPEDVVQAAGVAPTIDSLHPRHSNQLQNEQNDLESSDSFSEDADIQAAWKWRFSRKWQKEQLRQLEGATSTELGDDDEWSTALDYMAAAAGGLNLQFGRITSLEDQGPDSLDPNFSQSMSSLLLEASLSRDVSFKKEN